MLAESEEELGGRIEHATANLATLTRLKTQLDQLERQHAELRSTPTTADEPEAAADTEGAAEETGEVIDLTDSEPSDTADGSAQPADSSDHAESTDDADAADPLDEKLADAKARVAQHSSPGDPPEA